MALKCNVGRIDYLINGNRKIYFLCYKNTLDPLLKSLTKHSSPGELRVLRGPEENMDECMWTGKSYDHP